MSISAPGRPTRHGTSSDPTTESPKASSSASLPKQKQAEAQAETRRNELYSRAPRSIDGQSSCQAPALPSRSATDALAPTPQNPRTMAELGTEILSLRSTLTNSLAEPERAEREARLRTLSSEWCALARSYGMKPPSESFDPFRASRRELTEAIAWTEFGNTFPVRALADGGKLYKEQLVLAHVVRSPALLGQAAAAFEREPSKLLGALYKELHRLGDNTPCKPDDTVASLIARRSNLVRLEANRAAAETAEEERRRPTLGLDGRVGSAETIARYELEQQIAAANPGTPLGAFLASQYAGDTEAMRHAGELGNAVTEAFHGAKEPRHAPRVHGGSRR